MQHSTRSIIASRYYYFVRFTVHRGSSCAWSRNSHIYTKSAFIAQYLAVFYNWNDSRYGHFYVYSTQLLARGQPFLTWCILCIYEKKITKKERLTWILPKCGSWSSGHAHCHCIWHGKHCRIRSCKVHALAQTWCGAAC